MEGYAFTEEDKLGEKGGRKGDGGKVIGEALIIAEDKMIVKKVDYKGMVKIGVDEMLVKKEYFEKMEKRIKELAKEGGGNGDENRVMIKDYQVLIWGDHYTQMHDRCLQLEKENKELKGEERLVMPEQNLKTIKVELKHVRKNLGLMAEGKEIEEVVDKTQTPWKRRASQSDQPSSKSMAKMVARKTVDQDKEMPDEIEGCEKGNMFCKLCDLDEKTYDNMVEWYKKYHKNETLFTCCDCGKGFITSEGHWCHVQGHNAEKRIKCLDNTCTKTFTMKLSLKAHMKLKHRGEKERIKCKFAEQGCEKTFSQRKYGRAHF